METDCCSHPEYQPGLRALRPVARKRPISFPLQAEMCATQTHLSALPTDKGHHIITQVSLQNKNLTRTHMLVSQTFFFLLFLTKSQFNELPFNFALKLSKKQKNKKHQNKKHRFHLLFPSHVENCQSAYKLVSLPLSQRPRAIHSKTGTPVTRYTHSNGESMNIYQLPESSLSSVGDRKQLQLL